MDFKQLKTNLHDRLKQLTSLPIYNVSAPSDCPYPYLVFSITSGFEIVRSRADKIVEIDYWNDSNDDSTILAESEKVKQGLNYMWLTSNDGFLASYLDFEAELPTNEKNVVHINQRFLLKIR